METPVELGDSNLSGSRHSDSNQEPKIEDEGAFWNQQQNFQQESNVHESSGFNFGGNFYEQAAEPAYFNQNAGGDPFGVQQQQFNDGLDDEEREHLR